MTLATCPDRNKLFSSRKAAEEAIDRTKRDKERSWADLAQCQTDSPSQYPEHNDNHAPPPPGNADNSK